MQWLTPTYVISGALFVTFWILVFTGYLSIDGWEKFSGTFKEQGAQLLLLWFTDMVVLILLIRYWQVFNNTLQNFIVGILSGINGAFLGAVGARQLDRTTTTTTNTASPTNSPGQASDPRRPPSPPPPDNLAR